MPKKPYLVVQERAANVQGINTSEAKTEAEKAFGAYVIADHPDISEGRMSVRENLYENLPMFLNLADSKTVIGRAAVHRDLETGKISITIEMGAHEAMLMDHLVEICEMKAIGFAGYLKENVVSGT